jgi:hypothetical protein
MARAQVVIGETASRYEGEPRIYRIRSRGQPIRGGSPAFGLGKVLKTPRRRNLNMLRIIHRGLETGLILQTGSIWLRIGISGGLL